MRKIVIGLCALIAFAGQSIWNQPEQLETTQKEPIQVQEESFEEVVEVPFAKQPDAERKSAAKRLVDGDLKDSRGAAKKAIEAEPAV